MWYFNIFKLLILFLTLVFDPMVRLIPRSPGVMMVETGELSMSSFTVTTLTLYSTPGLRFSRVQEFSPASTNSSTLLPCWPLVGVQVTL